MSAYTKTQKEYWEEDKANRRSPHHPVVQAAFAPLASLVASLVNKPEETRVLDVGCGNGFLGIALEKCFPEVVGLDFSEEMLTMNPCKKKCLGASSELPFPDNSFDVVVASHLLHHLVQEDRLRTLKEMKRVARAAVVSFEPNRSNIFVFLFSLLTKEERMALRFTKCYMKTLFNKVGFNAYLFKVSGWIVPNKAPLWWIPIGQCLSRTPFQRFGFHICSVGMLLDE